ncbi:alpha/beta fold hydrolase [Paracoccus liaowanqingii]|uniref:Alpha/beta fold hydrolase n=1 Tax=Paracoccus liaowanqingii TaxID=2560053 RepID=A0A4Z1CKA0_9RHOB|nr:alpha/beta fold hydrolase [Paracoccus liaowanqingii]TGN49094.1 alpha/beta fold hydrolase [Paracoccus liaowanqingii]
MLRSRTVTLGDIVVAVDEWPADAGRHGLPLLFLHGAVQTRSIWVSQTASLAGSRRIMAVDLRGHGETMQGSRPMTVAQMAADVLSLLDQLQIQKVAVCGVSLGGMVALKLAEQAPDRISSLILSNTPTSLTSNRWLRSLVDRIDPQNLMPITFRLLGQQRAARLGLAVAAKAVGPRWVGATARRHFIEGFERMDAKAIVGTYRAIVEARPVDPGSIRCPVLLIKGDADAPSIDAQMDELGEQLGQVRIETVQAGHVASLDNPAAFNRLLTRFLEQHDPA